MRTGGKSRTFRISGPFRSFGEIARGGRFAGCRGLPGRERADSAAAAGLRGGRRARRSRAGAAAGARGRPPREDRRPAARARGVDDGARREARPAEGNGRPPRQGAREGRADPRRPDTEGARAHRALLRPHRAPLPLQELRRCRRRGRPGCRSGFPPYRGRGDASLGRRRPDVLRRSASTTHPRRRHALRAQAREAATRVPRGRQPRGRAVRRRLALFRRAPDA